MANNLAAFNAQAFSKRLVRNLDQINVMLGLVNRDYEGEIQGVGSTVNVRTLGSVSTGTWTKDGTINYQNLAPATEPLTISDAEYFAFKVDDVDVAQNDLPALALYAKRGAVAIKNLVDAKCLSKYASAHANNQITNSGAAITLSASNVYGYFVQARVNLSKFNVPSDGRWMVVDPDTVGLLLNSTQFIRATDLGDMVVQEGMPQGTGRPGFVGRCAGFDVYESNDVPVVGGAKYLEYGTPMAISYAAQINQVEAIRLETTFATAIRGLLLHDAGVFAEASKALGYIKAAP